MSRESRQNWALTAQLGVTGLMWATSWNPVAKFFTWAASSLLINAIMPGPEPVPADSPSYSWRRTPNATAAADTVMPVLYGTARIKPVVKNRFVTFRGGKQWVHILYGFTGHRIDERAAAALPTWAHYTYYAVGAEIRPPDTLVTATSPGVYVTTATAEPGKTYRCTVDHVSEDYPTISPSRIRTRITWLDSNYWELGIGTAAITDIRINGTPITDLIATNSDSLHYETRPGLAEQCQLDGFDRTYVTHVPSATQSIMVDCPILGPSAGAEYRYLWFRGIKYRVKLGALLGQGYQYYYWVPGGKYLLAAWYVTAIPADGYAVAYVRLQATTFHWISTYAETDVTPADGDWYTVTLNSDTAENLEIALSWPGGLYELDNEGALYETRAYVFAQYRLYGTDDWLNFAWDRADFNRVNQQYVELKTYANGMTAASFPGKSAEAFWRQFRATAEDDLLPIGRYELRVAVISAQPVAVEAMSALTYGEEIPGDRAGRRAGFTFPGEALLAIHALATDKLNGDIELTGVATRSTVPVWDGSSWVDADATAHAWACYDILANGHPDHPDYPNLTNALATLQPIYGMGVDADERIDYDSFLAAAEYVRTTLGWQLNTVFDTPGTAWDAIMRICMEGRVIVYPIGARFYALVDKAETPSGLLGPGNIETDSFVATWLDPTAKADSLELSYQDEDRSYERTSFVIRASSWDDGVLRDPLQLQLFGTTAYVQAFALGRYLLNGNELLRRTFTARLNAESLQCRVGDVVVLQHALLGGWGGKLAAADTAPDRTLTLDQSVTLQAGMRYSVYVYCANDTLIAKTLVGTGVASALLAFPHGESWPADPAQYDNYAVVKESAVVLGRVIDISFDSEYARTVTALEYDARMYLLDPANANSGELDVTGAGKIAPDPQLPALLPFATAAGLVLSEQVTYNRSTGEWESAIVASWRMPEGRDHGEWEVSWRDVDAGDTGWVGEWTPGTSYGEGALVTHDGDSYISLESDNTTEPLS